MIPRIPWALIATGALVLTVTLTVSRGQERQSLVPASSAPESGPAVIKADPPQTPATSEPPRSDSRAPAPTVTRLGPLQQDAMAEILRIRRQQGDLLAGSIFAELSDDQPGSASPSDDPSGFAEALKRVMQRTAPSAPPPPSLKQPGTTERTIRCEEAYGQVALQGLSAASEESPFARALRRAARLLDGRANDAEDEREFDEADRLRELANQLRAEARGEQTPLLAKPSDLEIQR